MTAELASLIEKFKKERTYRDNGVAAKATYAKIKEVAKKGELVTLLEELLGLQ